MQYRRIAGRHQLQLYQGAACHTYLSYKYNPAIGYQDKPKVKLVLQLLLDLILYIPGDSQGNLDEQIRQL